jgi:methylenetetrahydrofolate reductase (NADPH)
MTTISFEFFPPKSLPASFRLWETIRALAPLDPSFVSVTYGAGGTTRCETHDAVETIGGQYGLNVAAHLTCVDATREETLAIARRYAEAGVREIVALRGDASCGGAFVPHPDGFADSCELISALADIGAFEIRVGAYPDPHPESSGAGADVAWLKRKVDAGATSAITQFFFEADTFFRFRDACVKAGIDVPILPGILPITGWAGTARFAAKCGAAIPVWLPEAFERAERDGRGDLLATAFCSDLCTDLIEGGAEHLHFYTLNRPSLTRDIVHALDLAPPVPLEKVA